jgi:hypothetical protein
MSDDDIRNISAKVEFYESCLDQLKKELPKYFLKHQELDKPTKALSKLLRSVASSESHRLLQNSLFLYANKCDALEIERQVFLRCESQSNILLDEGKNLLINPLKEIINDAKDTRVRRLKLQQLPPIQLQQPHNVSQMYTANAAVAVADQSLRIHNDLFEKHRLKSIKTIISNLLYSEISYHCRAVEELSAVLESLSEVIIDED